MAILDGLISQASVYTWGPLVSASRRTILGLLSRITVGQLVVTDTTTNIITVCGALEPRNEDGLDLKKPSKNIEGPRAELRVRSDMFWVRLLLFADMVRACITQRGCEKRSTELELTFLGVR